MHGLHLTADLHDCRCATQWLVDAKALGAVCRKAAATAGLNPVGELFQSFPATAQGPGGVTATVLLAESHLCVHTWPESRSVSLDVYVCNFGADHSTRAQQLMDALLVLFAPAEVVRRSVERGAAPAA
jgi:S-adenosylmethionine decarboxylase